MRTADKAHHYSHVHTHYRPCWNILLLLTLLWNAANIWNTLYIQQQRRKHITVVICFFHLPKAIDKG